jgi:glycerophosphoryl diester phosphodiesterase
VQTGVQKVNALDFEFRQIEQSCPWACCPNNEITVSLKHSQVPLLSSCQPMLTIRGMADAVVSNGPLTVTSIPSDTLHGGNWNSGNLILPLSSLMTSDRAQSFHFKFTVKNPNFPISEPPIISMTASIRPLKKQCNYDQAGQEIGVQMNTPTACSIPALDNDFCQNNQISPRNCGDNRPLSIRATTFITKQVGQNNANPCAPATISVTLTTSAPLYTDCNHKITISGLKKSGSCADKFTSVGDSDQFNFESFDAELGEMVVAVTKKMKLGCVNLFKFDFTHCADEFLGHASLKIALAGYQTGKGQSNLRDVDMTLATGINAPMAVVALNITGSIGQTVSQPCQDNNIYVRIQSAQPLYKACNPTLTIYGLTESQTESQKLDVNFWQELEGGPQWSPLAKAGDWQYSGVLKMNLTEVIQDNAVEFKFFFTLTNKLGNVLVSGTTAPCDPGPTTATFKVEISTKQERRKLSNTQCAELPADQRTGTGTLCFQTFPKAGSKNLDLFTVRPAWFPNDADELLFADKPLSVDPIEILVKSIGQDSPYPCDVNLITVTIKASKPMPLRCSPCFTVSGLTDSLSKDSEMLLSGTDAQYFGSTGKWTKADGSLSVCATSDLDARPMTFSFKIVNPELSTKRDRQIRLGVAMKKFYSAGASSPTCQSSLEMVACTGTAPATVYKHNSACHTSLKECWPLNVRGLVFEVKRIGQSTPHPVSGFLRLSACMPARFCLCARTQLTKAWVVQGCLNTISVTLRTNVPFVVSDLCQSKLKISGFAGAEMVKPSSSKIALSAQPGQCDVGALSAFLFRSGIDQLSGFGEWRPESVSSSKYSSTIELYSAQRSQAGQQYIFSFQVLNPTLAQGHSMIKIESVRTPEDGTDRKGIPSHIHSSVTNEEDICFGAGIGQGSVDMSLSEEKPCCLCDVQAGDAKPMRVKPPSFCVKRICHTNHWPCANNTLTITVSPTREVKPGQVITISGLIGASVVPSSGTPTGAIKLEDLHSGGNEHHLHFAQSVSNPKPGFGGWNQDTGELKLYVIDALECSGQYIVSFTVKNNMDGQECRDISIRVNEPPAIPTTGWEVMNRDDCQECPMRVVNPVFSNFHVTQSSATPCCQNTISIRLKATVPMWYDRGCPVALTVAGLTGICSPAAGLVSIHQGCAGMTETFLESSLRWTPLTGTMRIVLAKEVPEHQEVCFSFNVTNPSNPVTSDISKVRLTGDGLVFQTPLPSPSVPPSSPVPKIATTSEKRAYTPITVFAASFDVYQIGQSSPWLCQSTVITVLLRSNQPLLDSCNPTVTISGITGFDTDNTGLLPIKNERTQHVSSHPWVRASGMVKIKMKDLNPHGTSDCLGMTCDAKDFRFSFELMNPKQCTANGTVTVQAQMTDICGATHSLTHSLTNPKSAADGFQMQPLNEPVRFTEHSTCDSKYEEVTFGPRAWYLADNLIIDDAVDYVDGTPESELTQIQQTSRKNKLKALADKMTFDQCKPPFKRSAKSMSFGGASMQFPSHTIESYTAAVRMGAGALSCQVAFTKEITVSTAKTSAVCRDAVCDLAHTTDILLPKNTALRDKACTYSQGAHPFCCLTKLTATEFRELVAILPTHGNTSAATIKDYAASMRTEAWRTTVYQDGGCFKPMFVGQFIEFSRNNNLTMVPELLNFAYSTIPAADTPAKAAQLLAEAFRDVDAQYVFPQSTNIEHVKSWLSATSSTTRTLANAVYRFHEAGDVTWSSSYKYDFQELLALENPIRYASTGMQELLQTADWGIGGDLQATQAAEFFKEHCIAIFAGTLESWSFSSRSPVYGQEAQLGTTLDENKAWAKIYATKSVADSKDLQRVMRKDADVLLILDALFEIVGVKGVYSEWPSTVSHYINCVHMGDRYTYDTNNVVDFGPRPWYLADRLWGTESLYLASSAEGRTNKLKELQSKLSWDTCPGPHERNMDTMALGGAAMQFPRNSKEAFVAAARMGAGALGCEVTFSKDGHLVCREQQCDLHYTTDILLNPSLSALAAKCQKPFAAGEGARCCTTDFDLDELKTLCATMNMATEASAKNVAEYLKLSESGWRTTIYQDGHCSPVMAHTDFILLALSLDVSIVSELKDGEYSTVTHTNPALSLKLGDKNKAAEAFLKDLAELNVNILYPQSMDKEHVKSFLKNPKGANAAFRYGPGLKNGYDTWSNTYKAIFDELKEHTPPVKYASVAMNELLIANDEYGASFRMTDPAKYFQDNNMNIFVWTFDAWKARSATCYASGAVDERWQWYHGQCLSEGQFYQGECSRGSQCKWIVYKDADELLILHALFTDAKVKAVFSEWPATVSHYTSCVKRRPSSVTNRPDEIGFVRANDAYVGFNRCNRLVAKYVKQTALDYAAAPCTMVTIHIKLATSVPLWAACSPSVRLAGLTGSCLDLDNYNNANSESFVLAPSRSFDKITGLLRLDVLTNTKAGCEYDLSFQLTHSAKPTNGVIPVCL